MEFYYPFIGTEPTEEISAKKNALDGYTEFDTSFFEEDGAKIVPSEQELELADKNNKAKKAPERLTKVSQKGGPFDVPVPVASTEAVVDPMTVPYADSYRRTNSWLEQSVLQTDVLASEVKEDLDKIRASNTMKSKYTYISNLAGVQASLIGTKIQAIREINNSINKAHELELKRAKDIKDAQKDQQNDDSRMMDMYNAFINSPMGMYNNALNMPTVPEAMLGTNGLNPTIQGVSIAPNAGLSSNQLSPEQLRMRMEGNPNIEEVVMYEPSTGRRWFQILDNSTGQPVPGMPTSDDFLLSDVTIDVRSGTAKNRNIDRVWRLVNTENTVYEY